jgi:carbamoyltransferase
LVIIGLHNTGELSSAALIVEGKLIFGCCEERLNRQKYSKVFPHKSIEECLKFAGLTLQDVDRFAIGWNPAINISSRYRAGFSEWPAYPGERFYSNPNQLLPKIGLASPGPTDQIFRRQDGSQITFTYVNHHIAHNAGAFYNSGFEESALFSCDMYSEQATTVWGIANANGIETIREQKYPQSLGAFYAAITEYLGYRPEKDEWKVMGAAALGDPQHYRAAMEQLIFEESDGGFSLDLSYFNHFDFDSAGLFSTKAHDLLGSPRSAFDALDQNFFDLAASAQEIIEHHLLRAITWLKTETGLKHLCFSGGVAMNSVFNGKLALEGPFPNVFIPFSPDDSGNSIGAALWASNDSGISFDAGLSTPFLGPSFTNNDIKSSLEIYQTKYEKISEPSAVAAELLFQNHIIGWFQGRMEFGQRALGARSILANPCDRSVKDRINTSVKFREEFRPFGASILEDKVSKYFDIPNNFTTPYMEKVVPVKDQYISQISSVVHHDGSCRIQTVNKKDNGLFHDLILAFGNISGIPILLNTSFNVAGEPIVATPTDALRTFYSSGLDDLIIGNYLVRK